jgi:hypothetical protein
MTDKVFCDWRQLVVLSNIISTPGFGKDLNVIFRKDTED